MFSTWYGLWDFKDLQRRTASDKVFRDKVFNIAKNPKYCNITILQILQFYSNSFKNG